VLIPASVVFTFAFVFLSIPVFCRDFKYFYDIQAVFSTFSA